MLTNEPTLPERLQESLLRAGFDSSAKSADLIRGSLASDVPRVRVLALRASARRGIASEADWLSSLSDPDVDVRREALTLLAHEDFDYPKVFDAVVRALDDDDALVVDGAVFCLGEHLFSGAVDELCRIATGHEDARCRESAVAALGAIGDDRAREAILAALDDKPPVRRRAIVALSNFEGPDIDAALEKASEDRDWQVRAAVDQLNRGELD